MGERFLDQRFSSQLLGAERARDPHEEPGEQPGEERDETGSGAGFPMSIVVVGSIAYDTIETQQGRADEVLRSPRHPATQALLTEA